MLLHDLSNVTAVDSANASRYIRGLIYTRKLTTRHNVKYNPPAPLQAAGAAHTCFRQAIVSGLSWQLNQLVYSVGSRTWAGGGTRGLGR